MKPKIKLNTTQNSVVLKLNFVGAVFFFLFFYKMTRMGKDGINVFHIDVGEWSSQIVKEGTLRTTVMY